MKKSGFSLVELVLSIVVIAIALMTVPLMLGQSAKSNQYSLMQESILAARTKIDNILSFKWDQDSSEANSSVSRVMDVTVGDSELDRNTTYRRVGHIKEDGRRRMHDTVTSATLAVDDFDDIDDIDDFDGEVAVIAVLGNNGVVGTEGKFDYLQKDINLTTTVRYISDDTNYSEQNITFDFNITDAAKITAGSTNIKMVELNAQSPSMATPFVLRTFSSNIGQSKPPYEAVR